jgi:trans-2,3-dihydro-3-hydroxyanthranilate isomerase
MTALRFHTLDVFTDERFGGNPVAVVMEAGGLSPRLMQAIAREFNLSETVFVLPATDPRATHKVRIFTPARELPFAGHPTIGTAILLAQLGEGQTGDPSVLLEEGVGVVPVAVRLASDRPGYAQLTTPRLPEKGPPPPPAAELAELLSLPLAAIVDDAGDRPEAYSCGLPYLMLPVRDRSMLGRAEMVEERWRRTLRDYWAPDVYVFCRDPELAGSSIRARLFGNQRGIVEDPATGSAAVALAGYLARRTPISDGTLQWTIEQGFEMGRPSLLYLETILAGGAVGAVRLGGAAVRVSEGTLTVSR